MRRHVNRVKDGADRDHTGEGHNADADEQVQDDEFPSHDAAGQTVSQVLRAAPSHASWPQAQSVAYFKAFLGVEELDLGSEIGCNDIDSYSSEDETEQDLTLSEEDESEESDTDNDSEYAGSE